eukprot:GFKZ01007408.1.p1 GENE.GFKZ01007408.1~~GFKZ01007408.1.p1  ORF type:complete len:315 (+),score=36.54 GFKZ01007408.1:285-1229(+)
MTENFFPLLPLSSSLSTTPERRVTFKRSPEKPPKANRYHQYRPPPSSPHRQRYNQHHHHHHRHRHRHHRHHPSCKHYIPPTSRPHKRAVLSELAVNVQCAQPREPPITTKHTHGTAVRNDKPRKPSPSPTPLLNLKHLHNRRSHLTHFGAKAHLQHSVQHSLNLSNTMQKYYAGMLTALPAAQLHALYTCGRAFAPGLALLRQAELEESELAKIETEVRGALGKWAVVRLRADERRRFRMAKGLLREFVEREEGGFGGEEDAMEEKVLLVLAERVRRMRQAKEEQISGGLQADCGAQRRDAVDVIDSIDWHRDA